MKRKYLFAMLTIAMSCSLLHAQRGADQDNTLIVTDQFTMYLDQPADAAVTGTYVLDVSALNFPSEKELTNFCSKASFGLHTLSADFNNSQVRLELDQAEIARRQITVRGLNKYFLAVSQRMKQVFNTMDR